jgi:hypothetical protein
MVRACFRRRASFVDCFVGHKRDTKSSPIELNSVAQLTCRRISHLLHDWIVEVDTEKSRDAGSIPAASNYRRRKSFRKNDLRRNEPRRDNPRPFFSPHGRKLLLVNHLGGQFCNEKMHVAFIDPFQNAAHLQRA